MKLTLFVSVRLGVWVWDFYGIYLQKRKYNYFNLNLLVFTLILGID